MSDVKPAIPNIHFGTKGHNDLGREPIADQLIHILSQETPPTIMIDGEWGTGKTEFAYKTINKIIDKHKDITPIYFSAFAEDYLDNPFFSLMSEIYKVIDDDTLKNHLLCILARAGNVIDCVQPLISPIVGTTASFISGNPISGASFGSSADRIARTAARCMRRLHNEITFNAESVNSLIQKLKLHPDTKKIWLFIDELDRCRPTYALAVLEIVKHIIEGAGIKVVYLAHKKQLENSIRHAYGNGIDANVYLRKFVEWRIELPMQMHSYSTAASEYLDESLEQFKLGDEVTHVLLYIFSHNNHSLRDVDDFITAFSLARSILSANHITYVVIATYLVTFYPNLVSELAKTPYDDSLNTQLRSALAVPLDSNSQSSYDGRSIEYIKETINPPKSNRDSGFPLQATLDLANSLLTLKPV